MMNRRSFLAGSILVPLAPTALWADARERKIGFILVGVSWCGACKTAAPVLSLFCERRDISCVYAAPDQTPISPFSTYLDARGHPLMETVKYYPTKLLYSARADAVIAQISGFKICPFICRSLKRWWSWPSGGSMLGRNFLMTCFNAALLSAVYVSCAGAEVIEFCGRPEASGYHFYCETEI